MLWYPKHDQAYQHFRTLSGDGWAKFGTYRVVRGLKLPTLEGDGTTRFDIADLIKISQSQMAAFRRLRPQKTLSSSLLEQIVSTYQKELKCEPLDLVSRMMHGGPVYSNYWLSDRQLNCIAASLPYFIDIRYVSMENCGIKDEQAGHILLACQGLLKLQAIAMGRNQIGACFVRNLQGEGLQRRIEELRLPSLKGSAPFFALVIDKLRAYERLKTLDISGNVLSKEAAEFLSDLA